MTCSNYSVSVTAVPNVSAIEQSEYLARHARQLAKDTIASAPKKGVEEPKTRDAIPLLAPKQTDGGNDFLSGLIAGFSAVYKSMEGSVIEQNGQFAQEEQMDQTMSQCIIMTTNATIDKEEAEYQKQQDLNNELQQAASDQATESTIQWVITGVLIGLSVVAGLCSFGASLAAVPAEIEMVGMGADAALSVAPEQSIEMADLTTDTVTDQPDVDMTGMNSERTPNNFQALQKTMQNSTTNEISTDQTTEEVADKETVNGKIQARQVSTWRGTVARAFMRAKSVFENVWYQRAQNFVGAATSGVPTILQGLKDMNGISVYQQELATVQQQLGTQMANLQQNNLYFQWYQQLVQRQSGVVQDLVNQICDVTQLTSDTINSYRQISLGLANSA